MSSPLRAWMVVSLALVAAAPAPAFDFVVTEYTDDPLAQDPGCGADHCTLREAVIAANAGIDADRILLSAGTYLVQISNVSGDEDAALTGDLDLFEDVEVIAPGATMTTVDGNGLDRVFQLGDAFSAFSDSVRLVGMTIRGGSTSGGVGVVRVNATIEECELRDNGVGTLGSGLSAAVFAGVTITRSTFTGNAGLGVTASQASVEIANSTFDLDQSGELQLTNGAVGNCTHCTLGEPSDAVATVVIQSNSQLVIANSIVIGGCLLDSGFLSTLGGNLESTGDSCGFVDASDQVDVTTLALDLGALADHGGPTATRLPGATSVAVGGAFDTSCLATDQRGVARTTDCESGSVERTAEPVATPIFHDGFLQGDTQAWSATSP